MVKVILLEKYTIAQPDLEKPTEEVSLIDTDPVSDCCGVCGFNVVGLPVSSDEVLWIGYDKCEQWYHQLCVGVESEE